MGHKHPPKIQTASKFERRPDSKSYDDKKKLFEGGWEVIHTEEAERVFQERLAEWRNRTKTKLPKWFGERPGRKGEPQSEGKMGKTIGFKVKREKVRTEESDALDETLKVYIEEWRDRRQKELDELSKLKDKQAKRRVLLAEEEKKLLAQKKEEEERKKK